MMNRYSLMAITVAALVIPQVGYSVDTSATEGDKVEFTVTLNAAPNGWAVRYKYKTVNGSATEPDDYTSADGTVTFNSGVKEQKIYVETVDDSESEDSEKFKLKLDDQQVNGLYQGVTGWVTPTHNIRAAPRTIELTGQIEDNDDSTASTTSN